MSGTEITNLLLHCSLPASGSILQIPSFRCTKGFENSFLGVSGLRAPVELAVEDLEAL
jgi:hypothetical protein